MTFPLPLSTQPQPDWITNPSQLKQLRKSLINKLVIKEGVAQNPIAEQLAQISETLNRSAATESTAFENGSITSSATGNASLLTRQVERAISQVLGRTPGQGIDGFIKALNDAFPTAQNGTVLTAPSRSAVALESHLYGGNGAVGGGQLPVQQANLYRQSSIIAADALKVLASLEPFDPTADIDAVEALRSLIKVQVSILVEEFGRLDGPRIERVNTSFMTLKKSIEELGKRIRLTRQVGRNTSGISTGDAIAVTIQDETQIAAYELLKSYAATLRSAFQEYVKNTRSQDIQSLYSDKISRVNIMLTVIADSNRSFMNAMDAVGFTVSERRSASALFTALGSGFTLSINSPEDNPLTVNLAEITMNDFNDWIDRFVEEEAPSLLSSSGRFGLDFVTDQADTLFWIIGFVLDYLKPPAATSPPGVDPISDDERTERRNAQERLLGRVLSFDRVEQPLKELLFQLNTLADLGV
ncbi:MAG: hypothetical protein HC860_06410 [Alkalinema sp. RU_4_3]|nr:hypothetical protein [Alkalinema sp. RU_4_3]